MIVYATWIRNWVNGRQKKQSPTRTMSEWFLCFVQHTFLLMLFDSCAIVFSLSIFLPLVHILTGWLVCVCVFALSFSPFTCRVKCVNMHSIKWTCARLHTSHFDLMSRVSIVGIYSFEYWCNLHMHEHIENALKWLAKKCNYNLLGK